MSLYFGEIESRIRFATLSCIKEISIVKRCWTIRKKIILIITIAVAIAVALVFTLNQSSSSILNFDHLNYVIRDCE